MIYRPIFFSQNTNILSMSTIEELKARVNELEAQINGMQANSPCREKILQMTSEVVDSNPYRYFEMTNIYNHCSYFIWQLLLCIYIGALTIIIYKEDLDKHCCTSYLLMIN